MPTKGGWLLVIPAPFGDHSLVNQKSLISFLLLIALAVPQYRRVLYPVKHILHLPTSNGTPRLRPKTKTAQILFIRFDFWKALYPNDNIIIRLLSGINTSSNIFYWHSKLPHDTLHLFKPLLMSLQGIPAGIILMKSFNLLSIYPKHCLTHGLIPEISCIISRLDSR